MQYKNPHKAIKDHVDPDDLTKREIVNTINKRAQVIFVNESGMYSLVLSSKLEQAKKVKRWVTSEVLPAIRKTGKYQLQPKQLALPEPEKKFTFEFTEYELQTVAWACFAFRRNNNLLHELYSPLAAIGSKFAVEARDNAVEYRNTLRRFNEVVKRITVDIEADPETNWRVLKHIRSFNEKIFGKVETTI